MNCLVFKNVLAQSQIKAQVLFALIKNIFVPLSVYLRARLEGKQPYTT